MTECTALKLPISDSGCGRIRVAATSAELRVEYEYFAEELEADCTGGIMFGSMSAYRFRSELHSLGFAQGSYDTLVEIVDSEWRLELLRIEPRGIWGSVESKKHFAIFFSNNGYLEVIADGFEELPSREGLLESRSTDNSG